jgi:murein DD-endopeptidase MepM/ murein hydrolase activator NlpD
LVEEKAKEEQEQKKPTPQHAAGWKEKWRSALARIQCFQIRRSHRMQKNTRRRMEKASRRALEFTLVRAFGESLYTIGFTAEYTVVRIRRLLRAAAVALWHGLRSLGRRLRETAFPGVAQMLQELFGPFYVLPRGLIRLHRYGRQVRREQGRLAAWKEEILYLGRGIRRYIGLLPKSVAYIVPVCAALVFYGVVQTVMGYSFTLAVQVNGETVGYVENEGVFDAARETVLERISYVSDEEERWTIEPTYSLAISTNVMDTNAMVDTILRASGDEISDGTALYLDEELVAVCADGLQLRSYISSLISPYEDPDDANLSVSFNRDVELVDGLFLSESFTDYNKIVSYLSSVQQEQENYIVQSGDSVSLIASKNGLTVSELCGLNTDIGLSSDSTIVPGDTLVVTKEEAVLEVRITRTETWQEEIPYSTEKSTSSEYAYGTTRTVQKGENGIRSVTAETVYDVNGNMLERTIVRTETVKEAVPEKIVTGTKLASGSVTSLGSLSLMWPVPAYKYCSRWYSSGHKGVDICAPAGTPIYASASGTVTKAGYERAGLGSNYGYGILIDHGNGYSTAYAHCLSIVVSVGQTVKQGQIIGYVGSTGRSSGNHCHFEIRYNGSYLAPQKYFSK